MLLCIEDTYSGYLSIRSPHRSIEGRDGVELGGEILGKVVLGDAVGIIRSPFQKLQLGDALAQGDQPLLPEQVWVRRQPSDSPGLLSPFHVYRGAWFHPIVHKEDR